MRRVGYLENRLAGECESLSIVDFLEGDCLSWMCNDLNAPGTNDDLFGC